MKKPHVIGKIDLRTVKWVKRTFWYYFDNITKSWQLALLYILVILCFVFFHH